MPTPSCPTRGAPVSDPAPRGPSTPPARLDSGASGTNRDCIPEYLAPRLLLLIAYAGHCWLRPFWAYYCLHLALPLAWLVALATRDLTAWVATARHRSVAGVRFLLVAALFTTVLVRLPERGTLARDALRLGPPAASAHLLQTLREHPGEWVFVNQPALAFHAGVLVPPEAVVLSLKRLWLGLFTEDNFLTATPRGGGTRHGPAPRPRRPRLPRRTLRRHLPAARPRFLPPPPARRRRPAPLNPNPGTDRKERKKTQKGTTGPRRSEDRFSPLRLPRERLSLRLLAFFAAIPIPSSDQAVTMPCPEKERGLQAAETSIRSEGSKPPEPAPPLTR